MDNIKPKKQLKSLIQDTQGLQSFIRNKERQSEIIWQSFEVLEITARV